jgi:hypothetical protein
VPPSVACTRSGITKSELKNAFKTAALPTRRSSGLLAGPGTAVDLARIALLAEVGSLTCSHDRMPRNRVRVRGRPVVSGAPGTRPRQQFLAFAAAAETATVFMPWPWKSNTQARRRPDARSGEARRYAAVDLPTCQVRPCEGGGYELVEGRLRR